MTKSVLILGRQPALGLAELESLYGADNLQPIGDSAVVINKDPADIQFIRLGGSLKLAKMLQVIESTKWPDIEKYLSQTIPTHLQYIPEGKFKLGLSVYGLNVDSNRINATGLSLKKIIKSAGRSVRIIPNKAPELNTAQVLHNQLTGLTGWELLLIRDQQTTILAQTIQVQDIDAYAARDQARPKRDARVGMLPPKLAQIITNLAVSNVDPKLGGVVLDPFCGTGVVLQEALLMGFDITGSDIDARMVDFSKTNIKWLHDTSTKLTMSNGDYPTITQADATDASWSPMPNFIACESYLGRPFSAQPSQEVLAEVKKDVDTITKKFLINVARQTKPSFRMCVAVPSWHINGQFQHLPTLDHLEKLGYNRLSFVHAGTKELVYHREGQIVGRELVVLQRL